MSAPTIPQSDTAAPRVELPSATSIRLPAIIGAAVLVVALVAGWLSMPGLVAFGSEDPVTVEGARWITLPKFEGGMELVRYAHGETATLDIPLTNDGPVPVTVTGIELTDENKPMLEQVDGQQMSLRLGAGQSGTVAVQAKFANCKYYTERAMELLPTVTVHYSILGLTRSSEATLSRQLAVRSPTIIDCPDRTMDRSYNRRNGG